MMIHECAIRIAGIARALAALAELSELSQSEIDGIAQVGGLSLDLRLIQSPRKSRLSPDAT
jgi:hypothetical protein